MTLSIFQSHSSLLAPSNLQGSTAFIIIHAQNSAPLTSRITVVRTMKSCQWSMEMKALVMSSSKAT